VSKQIIDIIPWTKTSKPTLDELKAILRREGLQADVYSDPAGMKYGRHSHDFDDFVVIVSGKMKIGTDTGVWTMKAGDRLDLPAHTMHWAEVIGKEEVHYLSAAK
jgi:quercetin dioxygenase-like cupin family protein